ncbi:MAG: PqiC family protein [Alphaproteobacteria bacterium]|nr:PqiC family protein [Alphaproteobacteria bacterium]
MKKTFLLLVFLLTACGTTPRSNFYTLDEEDPVLPQKIATPIIGIKTVHLPAYMDKPQIVLHKNNQIKVDEYHRWAESLRDSLPRVLSNMINKKADKTLAKQITVVTLDDFAYNLDIEINRFGATKGKQVILDVWWTISKNHAVVSRQHNLYKLPVSNDFDDIISAKKELLNKLASTLLPHIQKLK